MYSGQVLRGSVGVTRIPDLLDTLRQEYENIGQEMSVYKAQRDDYERKRAAFATTTPTRRWVHVTFLLFGCWDSTQPLVRAPPPLPPWSWR